MPGLPVVIPLFLLPSPTVWTGYEDSAHLAGVNGAHICVLLTSGPGGQPMSLMYRNMQPDMNTDTVAKRTQVS